MAIGKDDQAALLQELERRTPRLRKDSVPGLYYATPKRKEERDGALKGWAASPSPQTYKRPRLAIDDEVAAHRPLQRSPGASNAGADLPGLWTRCGNSTNWSGLVLAASGFYGFSMVKASWTLPTEDQVGPPPAGDADEYRASIWVGLDGHRPASPSMPQIGTTIRLKRKDDGSYDKTAYAWAQWWVRGKDGQKSYTEVKFDAFSLDLGQRVSCLVHLDDRDDVFFRIQNLSTGKEDSAGWVSHKVLSGEEEVSRIGEEVSGAGACFVVERPMVHVETLGRALQDHEKKLYPLPSFGQITFTECQTALRPLDLKGQREAQDRFDLSAARQIRLVEHLTGPQRTELRAVPDILTQPNGTFVVNYKA